MLTRTGPFRGVNPHATLISAGVVLAFVALTLALPARSAAW